MLKDQYIKAAFPRCVELGLTFVDEGTGFDIDEVREKLGAERFDAFMPTVTSVFCCGHRVWSDSHPEENKRGAEVHCIYASDLEKFLEA